MLMSVALMAQEIQKVEELNLSYLSQPYGRAMKNSSITTEKINVAGVTYNNGIGTHSNSVMKLNLNKSAQKFSAKIGITNSEYKITVSDIISIPLGDGKRTFYKLNGEDKKFIGIEGTSGNIDAGSVIFTVVGDGKELYNSGIINSNDVAKTVDIDLTGINLLELIVNDANGNLSGDAAAWIEPQITYKNQKPEVVDATFTNVIETQPESIKSHLLSKTSSLNSCTLPLQKANYDWLNERNRAKAEVLQTNEGKEIVLTNGLVARVFRVTPMLATIDFVNLMSGENLLRAVSNEGTLTIDTKTYQLGGVDAQFEYGYIQHKWVDGFTAAQNSFKVTDFEISEITPRIKWAKSRWAGNKSDATGKVLTFTLKHSSDLLKDVIVKVNYEIYDNIPAISKWIEVENNSKLPITIDEFKIEQLAMVEPDSPVELEKGDSRFLKPNIHIESDWAFRGFTPREADVTEYWVEDPRYTSQCNYPMVTPCLLEVKLPMGPNVAVKSNDKFSTFRVWEMPFDSYDRDRKGMFTKQLYRTISPWLTENPIFMHCTSSDEKIVKTAIDQCVETGYEMVILSFGSGLNMEDESEENYAKFKGLTDYAKSKGIELGGYSLLSSRWISDDVDVINPKTGRRGGMIFGSSPCLSSDWGYDYFRKISKFYEKTGMRVFENDGSYPGNVCASTTHAHHKGLNDSQWEQRKQIANLYKWMCENGIYTNIPDYGYMHNGGTKVGIGYREVNWSLPRERQLILGRQINYDGLWERTPSMCWTFVPLTQYHGGGEAATLEPLSEHLKEYEGHMMQNYGIGIQACYRGFRLYDTDQTKQTVKNVIDWYKKYRDILNSDIVHLRRADGRDYDGFLHVNPILKEKGALMLFNPLDEPITRTIEVPLYYTGLKDKALVTERNSKAVSYKISRDYKITMTVTIPAKGYSWFIIN